MWLCIPGMAQEVRRCEAADATAAAIYNGPQGDSLGVGSENRASHTSPSTPER